MLKGEKYLFNSLTKAFEALCKCLYALHSWPAVTDHLFYFFEKAVYKLEDFNKNLTLVNTLAIDLEQQTV